MSDAGAKAFLDHIEKDKALRQELRDGAFPHIEKVAAKHGHKFTKEELLKQVRQKFGVKKVSSAAGGDETDTCHFI